MSTTTPLPTRSAFLHALRPSPHPPTHDPCAICLSPYDTACPSSPADGAPSPHRASHLPCGHVFGDCCIRKWLGAGSAQCPMCRRVLFVGPDDGPGTGRVYVTVVLGMGRQRWGWGFGVRVGRGVGEVEEGGGEWEDDDDDDDDEEEEDELDEDEDEDEDEYEDEDENSDMDGESEQYLDEDMRGDWHGLDIYGANHEGRDDIRGSAAHDRTITTNNPSESEIAHDTSDIPVLDLGEAVPDAQDDTGWSLNGGILLKH